MRIEELLLTGQVSGTRKGGRFYNMQDALLANNKKTLEMGVNDEHINSRNHKLGS